MNLITPISPEGTYAVITKHGEFLEIKKTGGIYMCMPYVTKIHLIMNYSDLNPVPGNLTASCIRAVSQVLPYLRQHLY